MSKWSDDAILSIPPKRPPSRSWWADAAVQTDRAKFSETASEEADRIVGNSRFGGSRRVHDKFPLAQKVKAR